MYTSENQKASSLFKLTILKWNFYRCFCLFQRFQPFLKEKNRRKSNLRNFWNAQKELGNFSKRPNRFNFFLAFRFYAHIIQGNLERECIEEECSYEECYEVTDQKNTAGNSVKILKIPICNFKIILENLIFFKKIFYYSKKT